MNTAPKSLDSLSCSSATPTAVLVLANGMVLKGFGCGAQGEAIAELCFNTAMTGYQEILTDPSYKDQIVLFTFPHIGNVGCNDEDEEAASPRARIAARGVVMRERPTPASSWRAKDRLDEWLNARGIIGISGVDTRALTNYIRQNGMQNAVIAHNADGEFDIEALTQKARGWTGLVGLDLASSVDTEIKRPWTQTRWHWGEGFGELLSPAKHVVVIDYGVKRNILRCLADAKIDVTIVPATTSAAAILALEPDGIVLSNGPGDPQATGEYSLPIIRALVRSGKPVFGICLGHQMLALAMGAQTVKMDQGHHGANHPVQDLTTGKVEIVSMNHGFAVDSQTLPEGVIETHRSLFDGSNCGIRVEDKPVFSVQHHPEASPGPHDSAYVFSQFAASL